MGSRILSVVDAGMTGRLTEIECHISNGLPSIVIVGSASRAVDEAKERLRGAFTNSHLLMPKRRITINLAPSDIPKDTAGLDLAIATVLLAASKQIPYPSEDILILGEIGLDGKTRPIRGIIGKLLTAKKHGINVAYISADNLAQATLVTGIRLYAVESLRDLYDHLNGIRPIMPAKNATTLNNRIPSNGLDMADVTGQEAAKRALEIAAAGGHNIIMSGPPGTGKSMLAKAMVSLLPELTPEELLEVTHLHSLASSDYEHIVYNRPFRSPHHTASSISIIGGGQKPRPGEISLSHGGVLFLDELPEFHRDTIEALRQPLEDRVISVARASGNIVYPANFILVATANPCPCGYLGSSRACECMPHQIARYQRKLSGPIMDRIDLYVDVQEVEHDKLLHKQQSARTSNEFRVRVEKARELQTARFKKPMTNALMTNRQLKQLAHLLPEAEQLLNKAATSLQLSPRVYMRTIKVGRTIADLDGAADIAPGHVAEALQYRQRQQEFL
ncbi:MAG TPA: YifB family Mg chelatase-like AAA ATPase [Candidatus Saccharibacteria bacterium]|nr:YifB family Mg chelatase-like AAA ATPase [Candidatus Saccharibacteria bacterium]